MQGHPEATIPAIQNKLLPMMLANFAVWPIAHLINFKFIPSQQRILYINCIQVRIIFILFAQSHPRCLFCINLFSLTSRLCQNQMQSSVYRCMMVCVCGAMLRSHGARTFPTCQRRECEQAPSYHCSLQCFLYHWGCRSVSALEREAAHAALAPLQSQ
jgi:hypothetical protein